MRQIHSQKPLNASEIFEFWIFNERPTGERSPRRPVRGILSRTFLRNDALEDRPFEYFREALKRRRVEGLERRVLGAHACARFVRHLAEHSFLKIQPPFPAEPFSFFDNVKPVQEPVRKRGDDQRCDADESQSRKQRITRSENLGCR